jgi:hypothetical protein
VNRLRWLARLVLAFALLSSILANILHADRNPVSMIIAGITPLCLFLALELVTRLPVQRSALARGRWVATLGIAGIAAYVSYWHMVGVALRYGEPSTAAHLLPLAVDGLIIVATINLFELARPADPEVFGSIPEPETQQLPPEPVPVSVSAPPETETDPKPRVVLRNRPDRPQSQAAAVRAAIAELGNNPEAVVSRVMADHPGAPRESVVREVRRALNKAKTNGQTVH